MINKYRVIVPKEKSFDFPDINSKNYSYQKERPKDL
jgi:hypothetical protein